MAKTGGQAWLADRLDVSQPRVSQLVADGRIPRKSQYTKGDVDAAKAVLLDARAGNNATIGALEEDDNDAAIRALSKNPERVARIKLLIERTAKLKLEREMLAGGYVKKEDEDKRDTAKVYAVRAKMQELPLRASLIAHKTERECEAIITDWMREVCEYFATA